MATQRRNPSSLVGWRPLADRDRAASARASDRTAPLATQLAMQVTKRELTTSLRYAVSRIRGKPAVCHEMATVDLSDAYSERTSAEDNFSVPDSRRLICHVEYMQSSPPDWHNYRQVRTNCRLAATVDGICRRYSAHGQRATKPICAWLDELWQRRIVRSVQNNSFDFSHDKYRDVAYAELSPIKQRYWHVKVAQALETLHADNVDPVSAQLAAHYDQRRGVAAISFYQRLPTLRSGYTPTTRPATF